MSNLAHRERGDGSNPDFNEIKKRFFALNRERLIRTQSPLNSRARDFLELLPLLFHVNHPILPGYVSTKTPAGIPEYTPSQTTFHTAKRMAKSFVLKKRAYRKFDIQAIYLMGSTGTIAYSDKSDFDIWVCYSSDLSPTQLEGLHNKAKGIEQWAKSLGVMSTIFLIDPELFRRGDHGHLTSESSGSALHYLLLEEFYRSSVLLAGRYPLWWIVPPEQESTYEDYANDIKNKRFVHGKEHIDFGGVNSIPAEEFYGATLWLLYKGIDSPYKSVLKIMLMEIYADEYPYIDLLSKRYKQAIYSGEKDATKLDPYLMMLQKVEEYLISKDEYERLDMIRRCFYFKVNQRLSNKQSKDNENWRLDKIADLVSEWNWDHSLILILDSRDEWKLQRANKERKMLIAELTNSYQKLSEFARNHAEYIPLIKPSDINILGRKLYATYERKAGKIERICKGIISDLLETHLSFHRLISVEGQIIWMAFSGIVLEKDVTLTPHLKRAHSLIELCAWCYFNRLIGPNTVIALYAEESDTTDREIRSIINHMSRLFPKEILETSSIDDFRQPAQILAVATFINAGLDPLSLHTRHGRYLTSNKTDSLRYGGLSENLAISIDQVLITSWREVLTYRYHSVKGLLNCIRDYIQWSPPSRARRLPNINAVSYSSMRANAIANRVECVFENIIACYYDSISNKEARFVLGVAQEYYVLRMAEDTLLYDKLESLEQLMDYLSIPLDKFSPVIFDTELLDDDILPRIYEKNMPGEVQLFYKLNNEIVSVYVLDERGSLFQQESNYYNNSVLISHYQRFFGAVHKRMDFFAGEIGIENNSKKLKFYRIEKTYDAKWKMEQHAANRYLRSSSYINLQVIADIVDDKVTFSIYCQDKEFSSLEFGDNVYQEVAKYIITHRQSKELYPIYITDIDLSRTLFGEDIHAVQTIHYLNFKKSIEEKLNAVIRPSK